MTSVLARNVPRYHAARRRPRAWLMRSTHLEDIARAPNRVNHPGGKPLVYLISKAGDQHVDDVGAWIKGIPPHVREDHRLRENASRVPHQVFEQRELARPQFDDL